MILCWLRLRWMWTELMWPVKGRPKARTEGEELAATYELCDLKPEIDAALDERRLRKKRIDDANSVCNFGTEITSFVFLAIASGVVGNAAWDALRTAWRTGRSRSSNNRQRPSPADTLNHLVKVAIVIQCRQHGLKVPPIDTIMICDWKYRTRHVTAVIVTSDCRLEA